MTRNGTTNANKFSRQDVMKLYFAEFAKHENDKASSSDRGIPGSKKLFRVVSPCLEQPLGAMSDCSSSKDLTSKLQNKNLNSWKLKKVASQSCFVVHECWF